MPATKHITKTNLFPAAFMGGISVILTTWVVLSTSYTPSAIWTFVYTYLGPTAYVFVPMLLVILSVPVHILVEPVSAESKWAEILTEIVWLAPLLGLLGTVLSMIDALYSLSPDTMGINTILVMIVKLGKGAVTTAVGIILMILARYVREIFVQAPATKKIKASPRKQPDTPKPRAPQPGAATKQKAAVCAKRQQAHAMEKSRVKSNLKAKSCEKKQSYS